MAQLPPPPPPPIELPASLGNSHCAYPPCNALDFLPLPPCPHCSSSFCTEHATPSSHQCPSDPSLKLVNDGQLFQDKFNDLLPDPNRRALDRDATEQAARDKKEAALAVLKRTFGADAVEKRGVVPAAGPQPTKPKVVSPVIALMKLKQRAKPVDGKAKDLQMDERLYLTVKHVEGVDRVEQGFRELFLNKTTTVGRALDLFAISFAVSNVNNTSSDPAKLLALATDSDAPVPLPNGDKLASTVMNGGSILLVRGGQLA